MHKALSIFEQLLNLFSAFQSFLASECESLSHHAKIKSPAVGGTIVSYLIILGKGYYYYFSFLSSETVNFLRPFFRRLANTLRPLAVSMRFLNPCTVLRR